MFRGSMVALVTPMHDDGSIDEAGLERLIDFHVHNGTDAIVAVGTTGESATLDYDEHCYVMRRTVEMARGRIRVIGGSGANSTWEAVKLTQCAMEGGCDAALLVAPYYNKPTQEGLYRHFKSVAEAVPIPQLIYNVPGRTAVDVLPDTVERLASLANVVGVKEATSSVERAQELIDRCGEQIDVFCGEDAKNLALMMVGAKGAITVTANVAPRQMHEMCAAAVSGERAEAERIDAQLAALHKALFVETNPIPVKWAVQQMGFMGPGIRLPMTPLSAHHHETVLQAMKLAGCQ